MTRQALVDEERPNFLLEKISGCTIGRSVARRAEKRTDEAERHETH
jgi:hypothetical protein